MTCDVVRPEQCTQHFYEVYEQGTKAFYWQVRCHAL